jgi:hypoxanthine phosphoribosyltransferase
MSISNIDLEKLRNKAICLHSNAEIEEALDEMATAITKKLANSQPIFLCIVLGALVPFGQLMPRLKFPLEMDYLHLTRYGDKQKGGKELLWVVKPSKPLKGRTVVIVDDILDEGVTLARAVDFCYKEEAKEVFTAVVLNKKKARLEGGLQKPDFYGLNIEDKFVFGYGLDYKGFWRNLDAIYVVPD